MDVNSSSIRVNEFTAIDNENSVTAAEEPTSNEPFFSAFRDVFFDVFVNVNEKIPEFFDNFVNWFVAIANLNAVIDPISTLTTFDSLVFFFGFVDSIFGNFSFEFRCIFCFKKMQN